MNCLYCGKEIGPIQTLRDDEFCNADHRKCYDQRLGKCLQVVAVPEAPPQFTAGFLPCLPMRNTQPRCAGAERVTIGAAAPLPEPCGPEARLSLEALIASAGLHLMPAAIPAAPPDTRPAAPRPAPPSPPVQLPEMQSPGGLAPQIPPPAGFTPLEFYSHRMRGGARLQLRPLPSQLRLSPPAFCLDIVKTPANSAPSPTRTASSSRAARVISMPVPAAATPGRSSPTWRTGLRAMEAVAAGLIVGLGIWTGVSGAWRSWQMHEVTQEAAAQYAVNPPPAPALVSAPAAPPVTGPAHGPLGWVRSTVAKRAAIEWTDTFKTGMEAWGAAGKSWAQGWSRNADGYVRTGQLALFRPSQQYRDYRLEFFAQIEKKSVGWVVRARDSRNYYAMKFIVIDPGPRPVIAIVHYPVLGGKPGRKVELPLSAMVHNNEGIHVAVEVKGKRVVTFLEGQEVDSWTDEALASGGVGFFSDAGEQARLYWMKVAANDDLLGRICARVADAFAPGSQTAAAPARPGTPFVPGPVEPKEAVLAAAIGYVKSRRRQKWNS